MSTALSATGSRSLSPRQAEQSRHMATNTPSPWPAPSVATHSRAGSRLQSSTFALPRGLLWARQSMVTPKRVVTPAQSHPRELLARASISRGGEKPALHSHPTSSWVEAGIAKCSVLYRSRGWGRERGLCLKLWHNLTYPWHQQGAGVFFSLPFIPSAWQLHLLNNVLAG